MVECVGVDVAKAHLDWVPGSEGEVSRVPNTPAGVRRLVTKLKRLGRVRVVLESTGGYEELLLRRLADEGVPAVRVNPKRVRDFGRGMGMLAKNDAIDARLLALFGVKAEPADRPQKGPRARKLSELATRRRQLMEMVRAEKARREHTPGWLRRDIDSLIEVLHRRVVKIDRQMDQLIAEDEAQLGNFERMQTVPGVGERTARALIADLPELGSLDRKQISSLDGLAPYAKDSGQKSGLRRIEGGRSGPRTALYVSAMIASRYNPDLKAFYERLRKSGKPAKVAYVAVARKLLTILNAIVRDQSEWVPMAA